MSTDPARLTDDEREDLWRAFESWTEGDFSEHMGEAVEKMLRARFGCQCGHAWEYHGPEVPGCVECQCSRLHGASRADR
jgi:hypothetical protein